MGKNFITVDQDMYIFVDATNRFARNLPMEIAVIRDVTTY